MSGERELWDKYCSFLEKPFSEQIAYCEERLNKYFEKWKETKTAKYLMKKFKKKFEKLEDVPLTTYEDYPILHKFGMKIDALIAKKPRKKRESLLEYYSKLFAELKPMLDGWMVEDFSFAAKTSGTTGKPKWIVHGVTSLKDYERSGVTVIALVCSESWGETNIRMGEKGLNIIAPIPYISGWGGLLGNKYFKIIPPLEAVENVTDMGRRLWITLKSIEEGSKPVFAAGSSSFFQTVCRYFKDRSRIFKEYYESLEISPAKFYMLLKWLHSRLFIKPYKKIRDFLPLKGLGVSGVNITPYRDFFIKEFEIEPTNIYGSTEFPVIMCGPPDRKTCLIPDLRNGYYEFIDDKDNVRKIDELKRGETYELVGTSFGSMLTRYRMEDLLVVVDFRDDGMPYFTFKSRVKEVLDFYGYFRITESVFSKTLVKVGLKYFEKWAVTKEFSKEGEILQVLMERPWEYSEAKAAKILFDALLQTSSDFRNYVKDFSIKNPQKVIKIKYLRKGAFLKYSLKKIKEGADPGQIKPPKIIPAERKNVLDLLESS